MDKDFLQAQILAIRHQMKALDASLSLFERVWDAELPVVSETSAPEPEFESRIDILCPKCNTPLKVVYMTSLGVNIYNCVNQACLFRGPVEKP